MKCSTKFPKNAIFTKKKKNLCKPLKTSFMLLKKNSDQSWICLQKEGKKKISSLDFGLFGLPTFIPIYYNMSFKSL
jgi:hypothetical protein